MPGTASPPSYLDVVNSTPSNATASSSTSTTSPALNSPSSPSWKNIFKIGSGASSRKPSRSKSALTLDTEFSSAAPSPTFHGPRSTHPILSSLSGKNSHSPPRADSTQSSSVSTSNGASPSASMSLTPSSSVSFGVSNRYSSNSSGTLSSESGLGVAIGSPLTYGNSLLSGTINGHGVPSYYGGHVSETGSQSSSRPPTQPSTPALVQTPQSIVQQLPTPDPSSSSGSRPRTKSSKPRFSSKNDKQRSQTQPLSPVASAGNNSPMVGGTGVFPTTPLSPKVGRSGFGATTTRLLRRVASAPNAKGFFTLSKSRDRQANGFVSPGIMTPTTPGAGSPGFLSPAGTVWGSPVPEVPILANGPGIGGATRVSEHGSLETTSSSSSSRRNVVPSSSNLRSTGSSTTRSPPSSFHNSTHSQGHGHGASSSNASSPYVNTHHTITHSQSVQHLRPQGHVANSGSISSTNSSSGFLSPPRGTRTHRALSSAAALPPKGKERSSMLNGLGLALNFGGGSSSNGVGGAVPVHHLSSNVYGNAAGIDAPARAPFRRTYSSNSIKVRSVSQSLFIVPFPVFFSLQAPLMRTALLARDYLSQE